MVGGASLAEINLCNALPRPLQLWFEPWAQEFELPVRAVLTLRCSAAPDIDPSPTFEAIHDDALTVWGAGGSLIAVLIDGVDQDSFTSHLMAPDAGPLSPKAFVDLVFGDHPEARPGGAPYSPTPGKQSWLGRLFMRFRHQLLGSV
jgi:hypothetical protein